MKRKRMPTVRELFPKASESTLAVNPHLSGQPIEDPVIQDELRRGRQPNKTEAEFGLWLAAQKSKGEIVRYEFEGIRLKWGTDEKTGNAMWYKPDWFVVVRLLPLAATTLVGFIGRCVEIKGAHIWDRDTVRFKGCRAAHPEFEFEMWQKEKGLWNRLM